MARISIADGQTHEMLDYITLKHIVSDNHKKSLEDTLETYDFITFGDKRFSQYLEKRNRIIIPDEDDTLVEFVIFEAHKYKDSEGYKAQVYAHASYLELKKASIIFPDTYQGTASQHAGRAVNNTGWRVGIVESNSSIALDFENHTNPFAYLKRLARELDLELKFRIEHDGTKITGRYVDLLERVGAWRNRTVEFGKDLDGIRRTEKQDIVTALLGIGPDDENGNRLEVFVEDQEALQRWGRLDEHGELHHLVGTHVIQSTRTEMTEQEAIQYTRTELNKRINTLVTYECGVVDLEHVPGMENKQIRHGDTIRIKDTSFNPPLYLEARVYEQTGSIKTKAKRDIKLGDFVEFTEEQVHDVWRELRKEIREKISQAELIEYTYDKITIDDKDEVVFKDGKTFAEAVGIEAKEYAETQDELVKQHANTVAGQAESNAKTYAEDRSAEALQQALAKSVAQEVYDNKMQEIADDLAERTTIEYVDGQLVDKVNVGDVYTIEDVDNMINNVVSITEYETDIDGIVQTLDSQSTQIGQNVEAIGLKADSSRVDAIEGTVEDHNAQFIVMDNRINSKVDSTYVQTAIDDVEIGGRNLLSLVSLKNYTTRQGSNLCYWQYQGEPNTHYTVSTSIPIRGTFCDVFFGNFGFSPVSNANGVSEEKPRTITSDSEGLIEIGIGSDGFSSGPGISDVLNGTHWVKLEKGNKATDWTPAPEDVQNEIDSVYSYASSGIDQLAGRIDLKAESSYVDGVESRVTTAEQTIDAIDGRISMVVSEQGTINAEAIASEISLTSSAIDLISNNINLVGAVTVLSDISGDLGTITAGEIYGAYIEGATIRQQGTQNYIEINNDGIFIKDNEFHQPRIAIETLDMEYEGGGYFPSLIRFEKNVGEYNFAIGTNGAGLGTGFVGFLEQGSSNRSFEIANPGGALYFPSREARFTGDVETNGGIRVGGGLNQWVFTNAVDNTVSGTHLYMRTLSNGEVRATANGTTGNYIPMRAGTFYAEEQSALVRSGNIRVESVNNGYAAFASQNGLIYLQTGGSEVRVTNWLSGSSYKPIRASSFPTSSSINTKTNREELSEYDAIRLLDNAYAHKYHLQSNVDNGIYDKQKIGMFSETVPRELRDENGVDPYSIVSVLWKVAQVQRKELTAMKQRIADLEMII